MSEILAFFTEPFAYDFMRQAMLTAVLVGVTSALLSCFLVLKGWSLMGDAVSHAVLPGVVIAALTGIPFAVGALVAALVARPLARATVRRPRTQQPRPHPPAATHALTRLRATDVIAR